MKRIFGNINRDTAFFRKQAVEAFDIGAASAHHNPSFDDISRKLWWRVFQNRFGGGYELADIILQGFSHFDAGDGFDRGTPVIKSRPFTSICSSSSRG